MKQTVEEAARTHWSESTYNKDAELAYDEREQYSYQGIGKIGCITGF